VKPFESVRDVFSILTEQGSRVALATDCKGIAFKRDMALVNADDFIAATACGDNGEHGKPDPRLVGMALRKLGIQGPQAVRVGDTPYDAEAGLEAGTKVAAVLTGGVRREGAQPSRLLRRGARSESAPAEPAFRRERPGIAPIGYAAPRNPGPRR
jgi:phosphoglycolate phosphatase-like HAD superfamily hydrolase